MVRARSSNARKRHGTYRYFGSLPSRPAIFIKSERCTINFDWLAAFVELIEYAQLIKRSVSDNDSVLDLEGCYPPGYDAMLIYSRYRKQKAAGSLLL